MTVAGRLGRRTVRRRAALALLGLALAALLAAGVQAFLVQAFRIPSASMRPTLEVGDRVLVEKVSLRGRAPERGDVVVFRRSADARAGLVGGLRSLGEGLGLVAADDDVALIKRVVGLPGEIVETRDGVVFVDGAPLSEPYARLDGRDVAPVDVPADHYWLLGDNRPSSDDSRRGIGPVPHERLVGRALTVLWPPSRVSQTLHARPEPAVRAHRRLPR